MKSNKETVIQRKLNTINEKLTINGFSQKIDSSTTPKDLLDVLSLTLDKLTTSESDRISLQSQTSRLSQVESKLDSILQNQAEDKQWRDSWKQKKAEWAEKLGGWKNWAEKSANGGWKNWGCKEWKNKNKFKDTQPTQASKSCDIWNAELSEQNWDRQCDEQVSNQITLEDIANAETSILEMGIDTPILSNTRKTCCNMPELKLPTEPQGFVSKCPNNHKLYLSISYPKYYKGGVMCDLCGSKIISQAGFYRCGDLCNYDLCRNCCKGTEDSVHIDGFVQTEAQLKVDKVQNTKVANQDANAQVDRVVQLDANSQSEQVNNKDANAQVERAINKDANSQYDKVNIKDANSQSCVKTSEQHTETYIKPEEINKIDSCAPKCINGHLMSIHNVVPSIYPGNELQCDICEKHLKVKHGFFRCDYECNWDLCKRCYNRTLTENKKETKRLGREEKVALMRKAEEHMTKHEIVSLSILKSMPESTAKTNTEIYALRSLEEKQDGINKCYWKFWSNITPKTTDKKLSGVTLRCGVQDQGWGNLKGAVDLKLCRGPAVQHKPEWEWNGNGSGQFAHVVVRQTILNARHEFNFENLMFGAESPFVSQYLPGDYFELWYKVGGGGGHELYVIKAEFELTFQPNSVEFEVNESGKTCVETSTQSQSALTNPCIPRESKKEEPKQVGTQVYVSEFDEYMHIDSRCVKNLYPKLLEEVQGFCLLQCSKCYKKND